MSRIFSFMVVCSLICDSKPSEYSDTDIHRVSFMVKEVPSYKYFAQRTYVSLAIPEGALRAFLSLTALKERESCKNTNITLVMSPHSIPLKTPKNESYPPLFDRRRSTPEVSVELPVYHKNVTATIQLGILQPGPWYGAVYRSPEPHTITQAGLAVSCKYKFVVDIAVQYAVFTREMNLNELSVFTLPASSKWILRFRVSPSTWQHNFTILSCDVVSSGDHCDLAGAVHSSWPTLSNFHNCSENCNFVTNNPRVDDFHYVTLHNKGDKNARVTVRVDTNVCPMFKKNLTVDECLYFGQVNRWFNASDSNQANFTVYADPSIELPSKLLLNDSHVMLLHFNIRQSVDTGTGFYAKFFIAPVEDHRGKDFNVTVCMVPAVVPFNGSSVVCPSPSTINPTNSQSEVFVPYPESGKWFLALQLHCTSSITSACLQGVLVQFNLQLSPCIHDKCENGGECIRYYGGSDIIFCACRCPAGWSGYGCTDDSEALPMSAQMAHILLLTLSNLFFIPATCLAVYRSYYTEAIVYFFNCFFSTFYHACDADVINVLCIMPENALSYCDFATSMLSFWVTIIAMAKLPANISSPVNMLGPLGIVIAVSIDRHSLWSFLIPVGLAGGLLLVSWVLKCKTRKDCYPTKRRWVFRLVPGLVLAGTGLIIFAFLETEDNYFYTHSLWHVFMSSCIVFLLPPKLKNAEPLRLEGCCRPVVEELREGENLVIPEVTGSME